MAVSLKGGLTTPIFRTNVTQEVLKKGDLVKKFREIWRHFEVFRVIENCR